MRTKKIWTEKESNLLPLEYVKRSNGEGVIALVCTGKVRKSKKKGRWLMWNSKEKRSKCLRGFKGRGDGQEMDDAL